MDAVAEHSRHLISKSLGTFESGDGTYALPRYLFVGPRGGGDVLRIGIFATFRGDEPEGARALGRLLIELEKAPQVAQGYALLLYPLCNPTGYEDETPHTRAGRDLLREFWQDSNDPEVKFLESEIWMQGFHGIITLQSDISSPGIYGSVPGDVLSESLLDPALQAAGHFVPRNYQSSIRGFPARRGIIRDGLPGILRGIRGMDRPPFELTIASPQRISSERQEQALVAALSRILTEYRQLQAFAQNI